MENNMNGEFSLERSEFIRKTYIHLAGALAAFGILEAFLIKMGFGEKAYGLLAGSQYSWLLVLAVFMAVSYGADRLARSETSQSIQYIGLGIFIIAEAVIFLPLIFTALVVSGDGALLSSAALLTGALVVGVSAVAFFTKKDFSFLRRFLMLGGFVALGVIVSAIVFGFTLGVLFSGIMILFAGASILYNTSNVIHHYNVNQYVAAALSLFSGIALMLWYVIQFFIGSRD